MEAPKYALIYILICLFLFGYMGNLSALNRKRGWLFRLIVIFSIFPLCIALSYASGLDSSLSLVFILVGLVIFWVRRSQVIQDSGSDKLTKP
jgi:hypothetical protein